MALRRRQHAGGFAIGLAELAVGGTRDQAASLLHSLEQTCEGGRGQCQVIAQCVERAGGRRLARHQVHEQAGDQRFGFLVPVRLSLLVVGVGMMVPTPLPLRVGAIVSRWAGPE